MNEENAVNEIVDENETEMKKNETKGISKKTKILIVIACVLAVIYMGCCLLL